LLDARFDVGQIGCALTDPRQGIANDSALRLELCGITHVLQLATAAAIHAIVITQRLHSVRRFYDNRLQHPFGESLSDVEADGSFHGYASLFGETDLNRDLVVRGAFLKSIGKRGASGIRMLFQHDPAAPIGVWREVREDHRGLFVSGRLMSEVAKAREVLALMRAGAIDGLSIGFRTVRGRTDAKTGVRSLIEVDLWEVSVVTFPMLPAARVSAVKGIGHSGELGRMMRGAAQTIRALSLPPCGGRVGRG